MLTSDLEVIGSDLKTRHFYETSWASLGLSCDAAVAEEVVATCHEHLERPFQEEGQTREARAMSPACQAAAKRLIKPVIERIFDDEKYEGILGKWTLFGVNYYETGDMFTSHRDLNNPDLVTVVIVSLCGVRKLKVEDNPPIVLNTGAITLLDGGTNPLHSAWCIEGPSVSVVADVPELLY